MDDDGADDDGLSQRGEVTHPAAQTVGGRAGLRTHTPSFWSPHSQAQPSSTERMLLEGAGPAVLLLKEREKEKERRF